MCIYGKIESNFIKKKLSKTSFKERSYIDNLIYLRQCILKPPSSGPGGMGQMGYYQYANKYPREFVKLVLECDKLDQLKVLREKHEKIRRETLKKHYPQRYEAYMKEQKKEDAKANREKLKEKKAKEREKKDWLKAGGSA